MIFNDSYDFLMTSSYDFVSSGVHGDPLGYTSIYLQGIPLQGILGDTLRVSYFKGSPEG
jgi:hypothetical protein